MRLDHHLPGVMTQSSGLDTPTTNFLPQPVVDVAKEVIRAFPHSKRVGNYLLGKTLGEGSFAKVKQALHTSTGEKVKVYINKNKISQLGDSVVENTLPMWEVIIVFYIYILSNMWGIPY